jgi:hypothetical protein
MAETTPGAKDVFSVRRFFRPDSPEGALGLIAGVIVLITPTLAYVFSQAFLVLLAVGLVLNLLAISRMARARPDEQITRAGQAGYAMAVNGVLLIIGLFFVGILDDFALSSRDNKLDPSSIGFAFTTVHILLAVGLLLVDNLRHARRADI